MDYCLAGELLYNENGSCLYNKTIEFHDSGCMTFPLTGTGVKIEEKLAPRTFIQMERFTEKYALLPFGIGGVSVYGG